MGSTSATRMQPFTLPLPNNATLTGLVNIPSSSLKYKPLVVLIHGGTYTSAYYDADAKHTVSIASNGLGVPVVAIDRPCYGGTTSFLPLPKEVSYHHELARWLHEYILPTIWTEFGAKNGCTTLVIDAHSLAVPSITILSEWQNNNNNNTYPFGGAIFHGYGTQNTPFIKDHAEPENAPEWSNWPDKVKDKVMMQPGTCDPAIYETTTRLNNPMPNIERLWMVTSWHPNNAWKTYCAQVHVPVLVVLAGQDAMWEGTKEHLAEWSGAFTNSPHVEGVILKGAPHCVELSYWGQAFYGRCLSWAAEMAASAGYAEGVKGALKKDEGSEHARRH